MWVWCVRSAASAESAHGTWPGAPADIAGGTPGGGQRGGVFASDALFLSGDTGGVVRLWDRRAARACVAAARVSGEGAVAQSPDDPAMRGSFAQVAIAGLALLPWADAFATSGFDGMLRVWDARTLRVLTSAAEPRRTNAFGQLTDMRLARLAVLAPDLLAAGGMDGRVTFFDFNAERRLSTAW